MKSHLAEILSAALGLAVMCTPAHAKTPPGRYVIGDDSAGFGAPPFPVVFDTKTKLTWAQQFMGPFNSFDFSVQPEMCLQLDLALKTTGWRVPTLKELLTLVDFETPFSPVVNAPPFIDPIAFPKTPPDSAFWSLTSSPSQPLQCVSFYGTLNCNPTNYVRCVR
jgi:hypothetical protein